jgi:hypothetical protein
VRAQTKAAIRAKKYEAYEAEVREHLESPALDAEIA